MEYEERIDPQQGSYIVSSDKIEMILNIIPLVFESETIMPRQYTTLHGFFTEPLLYCGMLGNRALFFLGQGDDDLFSKAGFYYDVTYILSSNRIGKSFKSGTFRDFFLRKKNGNYFFK